MTSITKTIRDRAPRVPFQQIARAILGRDYDLSLVVCADTLARRMNREHRKKTYAPNVLSFSLSKHEGEIFLNLRKAERESRRFGIAARERMALLFVHGCYHLKGLQHGRTMEGKERDTLRAFSFEWHGNSTQA